MNSLEVHFFIEPKEEYFSKVLAEKLGELGFESFVTTEKSLAAYIPENKFDENKVKELLADFPFEASIDYKYNQIDSKNWNEEWERTFNAIPDLITIIDKNYKIVRINKAMAERIGLKEDECVGQECFKVIHNTDCVSEFCPHSKTMKDGNAHEVELFEQKLNGDFIVTTTPVLNKNGELIGSVHVAHDITERKKAEELLRKNEERYRMLFARSLSVMMIIDPDTAEIKDVNQAACNFYGWEYDEFCKKSILDVNEIPKDEVVSNMQKIKNDIQNHFFFKHKLANGETRDVEVYSSPLEFNGSIVLFAIIHDITDSKRLAEALCESEFFFRETQQAGFIGSYKTDFVNNKWDSSEVLDQMFGIDKNYHRDFNSWLDIVHPDDRVAMRILMTDEVLAKGTEFNHDFKILRKSDGELRWLHGQGKVRRDSNNNVILLVGTIQDITDGKENEEALRLSEQRLEAVFNGVAETIMLMDTEGKVLTANETAANRWGMTKHEIIGFNGFDYINPDLKERRKSQIREMIHTRLPIRFEEGNKNKIYDLTFYPIVELSGEINHFVVFNRDITEQKNAEKALLKSEEKFRNLVWDMQVGVLLQGPKAEILLSNPKALELLGLTENQLLGKTSFDPDWNVIYEDGTPFPGEMHPVPQAIATGKPISDVVMGVYHPLTGKRVWLLVHAVPEFGIDGNLQQVVCTFIDITSLKKAENELRESEQRLKFHFENSPLAVVEWDTNFIVTQWSLEAERMFGWKKAETLGKPLGKLNLIYEEDLPIVNHTMQRLTSGEENIVVTSNRNITESGSIITAVWYNSVLLDENEKMTSILSLVQDITIQKKAEELLISMNEELDIRINERTAELELSNDNLRIAEEKYRTVADFTYNMETWMDAAGKYLYVSPSCYKITGYTVDEFMEDPALFYKIAHPDDREMVENHFREDMNGTVLKGALEFRIITKTGVERWIGHSCQPVYSAEGKLIGQRGSNRNITKQKKAELILKESEKNLRALTQRIDEVAEEERIRISREIHDEIGHLLTALKYDTESLINHSSLTPEQVREELTGMISMIEALIDTVRKIATELRPGILDHMGLLAAIEWKIKQYRLKNKICCVYDIDEMDIEFTKNETTFIFRILQEILTNITRHSKATHVWITINKVENLFIMRITDNGIGFDVTSSLQKGSLGLMGMIERAKSIGGEILIECEPNEGTTTTFILKK